MIEEKPIIPGGTERGKDDLVDSLGYSYTKRSVKLLLLYNCINIRNYKVYLFPSVMEAIRFFTTSNK